MEVRYTVCDLCKRRFDEIMTDENSGNAELEFDYKCHYNDEKNLYLQCHDVCDDCAGLIAMALREIMNNQKKIE